MQFSFVNTIVDFASSFMSESDDDSSYVSELISRMGRKMNPYVKVRSDGSYTIEFLTVESGFITILEWTGHGFVEHHSYEEPQRFYTHFEALANIYSCVGHISSFRNDCKHFIIM